MARHYFVFDLLVLTGILAFLYDFFLLGNIRPLSVISFGCLIGAWFFLVYYLPRTLEAEANEEEISLEAFFMALRILEKTWREDARGWVDEDDKIVDRTLIKCANDLEKALEKFKEIYPHKIEDIAKEVESV